MTPLYGTVYCHYCRSPGRISFECRQGASDGSEIIKCQNCKISFDAFSWISLAETLAGTKLPRPIDVKFSQGG